MTRVPSVCLVVLDGWGLAPDGPGQRGRRWPTRRSSTRSGSATRTTTLTACGTAVGLPEGQMGNSEVGHLNLGAGAVVKQDLTRIDEAVRDGSLASNDVLREAFTGAPRAHLIGLVSDGGVHSGWAHLEALIARRLRAGRRGRRPRLHRRPRHVAPRRRAVPHAGAGVVRRAPATRASGRSSGATSRWTATAAGTASRRPTTSSSHGTADHHADSGAQACQEAYERDETDEFIPATTVGDEARIRPGDAVFGLNFRPDRMREITQALADPAFDEVDRGGAEPVERYATLAEYEEGWPYPVAFPPAAPRDRP